MKRGARGGLVATAIIFALVPVALFWFGATRCVELSCIGPMANAFLEALTVIPLLILWIARRRPTHLAMLVCSEGAMTYATLRSDFDFSPQFMIVAIPVGLVVGAVIGSAFEGSRDRHRGGPGPT